jgi:hypothetical protein
MRGVQQALIHDLATGNLLRLSQMYGREQDHPGSLGWSPYVFKKFQQVRNFDKRIIWSGDKPFEQLSKEAFIAFEESQKCFNLPEPMSRRASLVIHHAASICHSILGKFSYDEWFDSCSYGKRAAHKLPRSIAYLDERVYCSSGTQDQVTAFNACLARDLHLLRAVREERRSRKVYENVKVTSVPKSFKAARIIAPDTILGGFLSRGLGDVIRRRLEKETHIDLALQQVRHRRYAQKASINGRLSTIDMSKASDSFVWRHIECLVPKDWHHALNCVRTASVEVNGRIVPLTSYMLMGSGHTFPLQTLLFYCLAEATRTLLCCKGRVSVYGDDIIVPTRMSNHFIAIMEEIGFVINSEKSFYDASDPDRPAQTFFRESCGGDFKGGVDVRPYMPECDLQCDGNVPRNEYLAWCHKLINGLLDRWDVCEIPVTLGYILHAIHDRKRKICFVPTWEVDHAGIKHYIPPYLLLGLECVFITYTHSYPTYWRLTYAQKKRKRRQRERPYIWYAYYLMAKERSTMSLPMLYELLNEERRAQSIVSYDTAVSLNGEPIRSRKGAYRWTNFGPKEALK